eukprot:scaffold102444_cov32-Tisochrysis_lutea.AAC.8
MRARGRLHGLCAGIRVRLVSTAPRRSFPPRQGLYDPALEKDSCGVGMVAHLKGQVGARPEQAASLRRNASPALPRSCHALALARRCGAQRCCDMVGPVLVIVACVRSLCGLGTARLSHMRRDPSRPFIPALS